MYLQGRIFDPENKRLIERAVKAFPKKWRQPDLGDDVPEEWIGDHLLAYVPGDGVTCSSR